MIVQCTQTIPYFLKVCEEIHELFIYLPSNIYVYIYIYVMFINIKMKRLHYIYNICIKKIIKHIKMVMFYIKHCEFQKR